MSPRIGNGFPEYRRLCSADSRQQPSKKTSTGQDKQAMKTLFKTIAIRERDDSIAETKGWQVFKLMKWASRKVLEDSSKVGASQRD